MTNALKAVTIMIRATRSLEEVLRKDIETYEMNTTEFGVLDYLYHKGKQPMLNICEKLLMANSSMTYVIDKMYKKELVKRINDEYDRRMVYIELTVKGRELFESIFPKHQKRVEEVFSILSEDRLNNLMESLKELGLHSKMLIKEDKGN